MIEFDFWKNKRSNLREKLNNEDLSNFLRWGFTENDATDPTLKSRIEKLRESKYIDIKDTKIGNPKVWENHLSINSVKQLSRLQLFEKKIGEIKGFDSILEFGSNYGNMCRIIHELGFEGPYEIFELPEYIELCKYFLNGHGIVARFYDDEKLVPNTKRSLFLSMFALCETPAKLREVFLNMDYDCIWIGYCSHFDNEIDKKEYFSNFTKNNNKYEWVNFNDPCSKRGREKHLVGIRK